MIISPELIRLAATTSGAVQLLTLTLTIVLVVVRVVVPALESR